MRIYFRVTKSLIIIGGALLFQSCNKTTYQQPVLPPATQSGANTFGGYINGKLWLAQNSDVTAFYSSKSSFFDILGHCTNPNIQTGQIGFGIHGMSGTGIYLLKYKYAGSGSNGFVNITDSYVTTQTDTGVVIITRFDTLKHVISGTLILNALIDTSLSPLSKTVNVTDGRFDVIYNAN